MIEVVIAIVIIIVIIHFIVAFTEDIKLEYKAISINSEKIPKELNRYKITFITDIHRYPIKKLKAMVKRINNDKTDLVVLGGDFSKNVYYASKCIEILSGIQSKHGFYGVYGNHDNVETLRKIFSEYNMVLLENSGLYIKDNFFLAGVSDLKTGNPNINKAIKNTKEKDFILLLCHNPDTSMMYDFSKIDLTLSGHTHGGEVTFFGIWSPAIYKVSKYGQRFRSGWCKSKDNTDVFVSNGIGNHFPIRIFARPQVIYLTLNTKQL